MADSSVTLSRRENRNLGDEFLLEIQDGNLWMGIAITKHETNLLKLSIENGIDIIISVEDCYIHSSIEGNKLYIGLSPAGFESDNVVWASSEKSEMLKMMEEEV